jgi:hypothetical protein
VPQKIKLKKQYKAIKFGDGPDPGTVEGHRNKMIEAAETRAYDRRMKELPAELTPTASGLSLDLLRLLDGIDECPSEAKGWLHISYCAGEG